MYTETTRSIQIDVEPFYLAEQSEPDKERWVFGYRVRIENHGTETVQLLTRHWRITDGLGRVVEVRGEGVVGEQPHLRPGEDFEYTSGAVLETGSGTMHGSYQMLADDGTRFEAEIAPFTLSIPRTLH